MSGKKHCFVIGPIGDEGTDERSHALPTPRESHHCSGSLGSPLTSRPGDAPAMIGPQSCPGL